LDIDPPMMVLIVVAAENLPLWLAASAMPVLERISFQIKIWDFRLYEVSLLRHIKQ
jgi:hypothetical protein